MARQPCRHCAQKLSCRKGWSGKSRGPDNPRHSSMRAKFSPLSPNNPLTARSGPRAVRNCARSKAWFGPDLRADLATEKRRRRKRAAKMETPPRHCVIKSAGPRCCGDLLRWNPTVLFGIFRGFKFHIIIFWGTGKGGWVEPREDPRGRLSRKDNLSSCNRFSPCLKRVLPVFFVNQRGGHPAKAQSLQSIMETGAEGWPARVRSEGGTLAAPYNLFGGQVRRH